VHVLEVMRPLPVQRVEAAPVFVIGMAVIRGTLMPVVDLSRLLSGEGCLPRRFVTLRVAERDVALAVADVLGTRLIDLDAFLETPPLLVGSSSALDRLGILDGQLLEVLATARVLEEAFAPATTPGAAS
jgi:purine-binding chemotaxis protein CheW